MRLVTRSPCSPGYSNTTLLCLWLFPNELAAAKTGTDTGLTTLVHYVPLQKLVLDGASQFMTVTADHAYRRPKRWLRLCRNCTIRRDSESILAWRGEGTTRNPFQLTSDKLTPARIAPREPLPGYVGGYAQRIFVRNTFFPRRHQKCYEHHWTS